MKKFLFLALFLPFATMAQDAARGVGKAAVLTNPSKQLKYTLPSAVGSIFSPVRMNKATLNAVYTETAFTTTYDVQCQASMSRRLVLHKNGTVGTTAMFSKGINSFNDRGSVYNYYDGTSFTGGSHVNKRIETYRTGYPAICSIMDGGKEKDLIVSHFASASSTDSAGGIFVLINDSAGSSNFSETHISFPYGPLWPKVAASGDYVHIIGNYFNFNNLTKDTVFKNGVRQPLVYYRYRISTKTFDVNGVALPGYDNTRYAQGSNDAYAIDAQDSHVVIVAGGTNNDVAFWKSADNGNNWAKTIVDTFPYAPYDLVKDVDTFSAWTRGNDGSVTCILDKNNNVHVAYGLMYTRNPIAGDTNYYLILQSDRIVYYDEINAQKIYVASTPGDTSIHLFNGDYNSTPGNPYTTAAGAARYGNSGTSTWPSFSIDDSGYIYMIYSAPYRSADIYTKDQNYRHIFYRFTKDGKNWSNQIGDLSLNALGNSDNNPMEDVFGSIARKADGNVYITWQRDPEPGTYLDNKDPDGPNEIDFAVIPVDEMKAFDFHTGISPQVAANFKLGAGYPNPTRSSMNVPITLIKGDRVSLKVTDMLGRAIYSNNFGMLPAGNSTLSFDVSAFGKGVYFYTITVGENSLTQKAIVE